MFSGTRATVASDNEHELTADGAFTGTFSGGFYGPGAAEAGGVFDFTSTGMKAGEFGGAFGGRKRARGGEPHRAMFWPRDVHRARRRGRDGPARAGTTSGLTPTIPRPTGASSRCATPGNVHKNARLTPKGREILVRRIEEEGLRVAEAAQAAGVSERTAYKWRKRFREEGVAGLGDRSSRPHGCPHETDGGRRAEIESLRRRRLTYREIAERVGVGTGTVSRVLRRAGLNRLPLLDPPPPVQRCCRPRR